MHRRPKPETQEVVWHNIKNSMGEWMPQVFTKGCWVYMQPSNAGPHRVWCHNMLERHCKGTLMAFKETKFGMVAVVKHVYGVAENTYKELQIASHLIVSLCRVSLWICPSFVCFVYFLWQLALYRYFSIQLSWGATASVPLARLRRKRFNPLKFVSAFPIKK